MGGRAAFSRINGAPVAAGGIPARRREATPDGDSCGPQVDGVAGRFGPGFRSSPIAQARPNVLLWVVIRAGAAYRMTSPERPFVMLRLGGVPLAVALLVLGACRPVQSSAAGALAVSSAPAVTIAASTPDGSVLFSRATSATRLPDGTIVVADGGDQLLRFFDSTGRPLRTAGHPGAGPGEFQSLFLLPHCVGDSLVVWDGLADRISTFDTAGKFARSVPLPRPISFITCRRGTFAALLLPQAMVPGQALRSRVLLFNGRGDSTGGIPDVPLGEMRPMGRHTTIALAGDTLWLGSADSGAVDRYALAGIRAGSVSLGLTSRSTTDAEYEREIDREVAPFPAGQRAAVKGMLLKMPKPAQVPAYGLIMTDDAGDLWVTTSLPADSVTTFRVVSPAGEVLANVSLPGNVTLMEVGRDYLLGLVTGTDGEQRVVEYGVKRGAGGADEAGQAGQNR